MDAARPAIFPRFDTFDKDFEELYCILNSQYTYVVSVNHFAFDRSGPRVRSRLQG